ncbi:tetratricopeptide repeat protein [Winogradskyella sp. 3972H.M.0a.05]|uniref:tetratricopeptide repeat protein n=1 Tax=Winogradskyella sp. 3972H.M.0a.05 TaxID=2950277 RepID=UPI0033940F36
MGLTIADAYYLKAKGASCGFFSDWEEVCEALNYALSYDENHCASLMLLGDIYAAQLSMYEDAFRCFDKVIAIDPNNIEVYGKYARYLIWANEVERAEKLITFASSIKAMDKAYILWLSAYLEDVKGQYENSLKLLKEAKQNCYNDGYFNFMSNEEKRIKKKMELEKPKKKKKKKPSKNKKKAKKND